MPGQDLTRNDISCPLLNLVPLFGFLGDQFFFWARFVISCHFLPGSILALFLICYGYSYPIISLFLATKKIIEDKEASFFL